MIIYDMDIYLLLYLILIVAPLSIVLHEMGHAFAARIVNADLITVTIGKGKRFKRIGLKRTQIIVYSNFLLGGVAESIRNKPYNSFEVIWITIFGPILSGIIAFLFYILNEMYPNNYLQLFFWFNIWLAVVNIIPFKIKGKQTDGYMIIKVITQKYPLLKCNKLK